MSWDVRVEIAFNAGVRTAQASYTWTDVSAYVDLEQLIEISRGRGDQFSIADANRLKVTLDNRDGRFTAGLASGAHYPNVKVGRPIRVRAARSGGSLTARYLGFVDEWPVEWSGGSDVLATATISASSRIAVLGRARKLRSIIEEEYLLDSPAAYYPLSEAQGASVAADISGNAASSLVQTGAGTAVTFGTETGPSTDGLTAAQVTAGGKYLRSTHPDGLTSGTVTIEVAFRVVAAPAAQATLWQIRNADIGSNPSSLAITMNTDGTIEGALSSASLSVTTGSSLADGSTHFAALTHSGGADAATITLYVDGVLVGSDTDAVGVPLSGYFSTAAEAGDSGITATLAHAAVFDTALSADRIAAHAEAGLTGFLDETPGDRLARYAAYAGIPAAETNFDTGTSPMAHIDTTDKTALEVMRLVEQTDGGVLYDGKDGVLQYRSRASRYGAASAFTLSFANAEVEADFAVKVDRSQLQNDVTVSLADGTVTARALDSASVDDYDASGDALELHTTDTEEPFQAASWRVGNYAEPAPRVPSLTVDLVPLATATQDAILAAEIGARFATTGGPSQAASTSGDWFGEGVEEAYGVESVAFKFNVSDGAVNNVWLLNDSTYSVLDSTTRLAY